MCPVLKGTWTTNISVPVLFPKIRDVFRNLSSLDEMESKIDDLKKSVNDLKSELGTEICAIYSCVMYAIRFCNVCIPFLSCQILFQTIMWYHYFFNKIIIIFIEMFFLIKICFWNHVFVLSNTLAEEAASPLESFQRNVASI